MATEHPPSLGLLLRQHRLTRELTQEELAEKSGLSPRVISDIERGGPHLPRRDTLALLAQALALTAEERATFVAAAHAPRRTVSSAPSPARTGHGSVPAPLTPLLGRDQEAAAIIRLLQGEGGQVRLLTLTGAGGTGKTRLALHLAATMAPCYPDGVVVVSLAALRDPGLVPVAIADALQVPERWHTDIQTQLIAALQDKHLLLVLDNFEQVDQSAPLVTALLMACPAVAVLVTSRHLLHLQGEHEVAVPPLALPDLRHPTTADALATYAAIALFTQRAQAVVPGFALTEATAPVVAEICVRLDGLPLALELAAARLRLLSPQVLLERLSNRLTVLTGGARDLPARQQTLRTTIAWSFDLLSPDEQALFRRLAVFVGGWTLEAAERVCVRPEGHEETTILDGLASLGDKSLMHRVHSRDGEPRFALLETVRDYAAEQLATVPDEGATMRRAHAAYYLSVAEAAAAAGGWASHWGWLTWMDIGHAGWQAQLTEEQANLRSALQWAQENGNLDVGSRLVGALGWFWFLEGHWTEGRAWFEVFHTLEQASAATGTTPAPAAPLTRYLDAAGLARMQGDAERVDSLLKETLALLRQRGDRRGVAVVLACLGGMEDAPERAAALFAESLTLCREAGDAEGVAFLLASLGDIACSRGDEDGALALHAEAGAVARAQGESRVLLAQLERQGMSLAQHGDLRVARALLEEALALALTEQDRGSLRLVGAREGCAMAARAQGEYAAAVSLLEQNLALLQREWSHQQYLAWTLLNLGRTSRESGDLAVAAEYTAESLRLAALDDDVSLRGLALENQALIAWEHRNLAPATHLCTEALALCRTVRGAGDSVSRVLVSLGLIFRSQGDLGRARACLAESLQRAGARMFRENLLLCLDGLAGVATAQGHHEHAVRLFSVTATLRAARGGVLPPALRMLYDGDLRTARAALSSGAFSAAWTAGAVMSLNGAVADALHDPAPE